MILDAYTAVYVWIGPQSTEDERKGAMQTSVEYVEAATDGRPKNCPVSTNDDKCKCGAGGGLRISREHSDEREKGLGWKEWEEKGRQQCFEDQLLL